MSSGKLPAIYWQVKGKDMKKDKCYIYMRVSTSMQVEGYSLEAQKERLQKFAEFQHLEIVREYCDAGKSGKNITGRPEFTQMLQDVANDRDGVKYILVFKLSRFGRNAADVLNSLQYIQDFGVNLICVEDGIDSSKDSGKLTITVLSAVAEIERENILVQTMEGRKQKAREGKWNGGQAPFGYKLDKENDTITIEPKDAEVVRLIYEKYVNDGLGIDRICDYLNTHGYTKTKVRARELTYFTRTFLARVLDNPVYIGKIAYGKSTTEKVKGTRDQYRRVKAEDPLIVDGKHEAIVSEELWEAAQAKRKENSIAWNKTHSLDHEHILSGLIKCPICGTGLTGTVARRTNKETGEYRDIFYYRCHRRKKIDEEHFCNYKISLNQDAMNKKVEDVIVAMVSDESVLGYIKEKLGETVDVSTFEAERDRLRDQLRQLTGAKKKLADMLDALDVTDRHYDRKYQDMQDRLDNLYDKISVVEESITDVNGKISAAYSEHLTSKELFRVLENFNEVYYKMTDLEKKEFFQKFIRSIEIYPDRKVDEDILKWIHFRFPIYYDSEDGGRLCLPTETTVETVCLLGKQDKKPDSYIDFSLNMEDYYRIKGGKQNDKDEEHQEP